MSALCERIRGRLPEYGREALPAGERRAVREHLGCCAACRARAAAEDPVLLFSSLSAEAVSSEEVGSIVASVRAGVALRQAERRIESPSLRRRPGQRRAVRAGAAAAVLLFTLVVPSGLRSPEAGRGTPVRAAPVAGISAVAGPPGPASAGGGATVYDLSPGVGEPHVVWIVDESLDI